MGQWAIWGAFETGCCKFGCWLIINGCWLTVTGCVKIVGWTKTRVSLLYFWTLLPPKLKFIFCLPIYGALYCNVCEFWLIIGWGII